MDNKHLTQIIADFIQQKQGSISFADFMSMALYYPGLGYYVSGYSRIGKQGDFITAPEISPLFSTCLATQCREFFDETNAASILEFGAGNGTMAADLLIALDEQNSLPLHYFIMEPSPVLQAKQYEILSEKIPHFIDNIIWLDRLPTEFNGIILANEVLDAMPVHLVTQHNERYYEKQVTIKNGAFDFVDIPLEDPYLIAAVNKLSSSVAPFSENYIIEINLMADAFIKSLYDMLQQGLVLLIDYGFGAKTYYHPDRFEGTLMCHYQHKVHADPFLHVGEQDITAHVNFTAIADSALEAGFRFEGYTTQAQFLLHTGLLEAGSSDTLKTHLSHTQAIHQLTSPSEMGELFKVMALSKNCVSLSLQGFSGKDYAYQL
jgi:SAM-dependent MidA family methyltransferase